MRIAAGTAIIRPVALKTEWQALYGGTLFVIGIVLLMKIQMWFPKSRELLIFNYRKTRQGSCHERGYSKNIRHLI
ncbi:hypothetical protein M3221_14020 [Domibacillus indicus]|uniref:hypothetical protein n=1 Tax=Domibacillus indicus TaxID=1437523 RepID=UPI00203D2274|nr:hypothetical protein [Domibacillus indicus]MCM3789519.1 hypothetical protein [Domibacillus indicus]